jgi:mercuric ion binding protein
MKSIQIVFIGLLLFVFSNQVSAQKAKTEKVTFKVYGNCPMCKSRMETACDAKGIKMAEWDVDTKIMTVVFNPAKITLEQIHQLIADSGHDTDLKKANDAVYKNLPDCCLYREKPNTHHD